MLDSHLSAVVTCIDNLVFRDGPPLGDPSSPFFYVAIAKSQQIFNGNIGSIVHTAISVEETQQHLEIRSAEVSN